MQDTPAGCVQVRTDGCIASKARARSKPGQATASRTDIGWTSVGQNECAANAAVSSNAGYAVTAEEEDCS
jgi:hypothetical protein